jgi:hypothetical protein
LPGLLTSSSLLGKYPAHLVLATQRAVPQHCCGPKLTFSTWGRTVTRGAQVTETGELACTGGRQCKIPSGVGDH